MQLIRFADAGDSALGVVDSEGRVFDASIGFKRYLLHNGGLDYLRPVLDAALRDPRIVLSMGPALQDILQSYLDEADDTDVVAQDLRTLDVLPFIPNPSKVFGLGYNYRALCEKEGVEPTVYPQVFAKMPTSITSPYRALKVPSAIDKVDFEAELGVVVGRVASGVRPEDALSYLGGLTVINDMTAKILPRPPTEAQTTTVALKAPDYFAPVGPVLLTPDEYEIVENASMVTRVNGQERQRFPVNDWVHDVAHVISYLSSIITLHPGDIIAMGTSLGIGIIEVPPVLLQSGDVVECEIDGYPGTKNEVLISQGA
jgi:acylpyruvate hydrolase